MKSKLFVSLMLGCAVSAMAQGGYQDGVDYFNASRFEDAKTILTNTLNAPNTDKAVSYYYLGAIDLQEGKSAEAKANFDKGLEINPASALNQIGLGEIALKAGDKKTAESYFKEAEKAGKKDASVYAGIARAYFNVDPTLYAKEIEKYIQKGFKQSKYTEPSIFVLQGDMLSGVNPGEAAALYETAMRVDEEKNSSVNPEAYVKYANTYFRVNPRFAIQKLEELNEKLPTSALAQRELAEKYYEGNMLTKAADQYGKYMSNPNHFQRDEQRFCGLLYFGKKYDESLAIAEKVLKQDPNNFYMWRMKMYNLLDLGKYDEALQAADRFFTLKGDFNYKDYDVYGDILGKLDRSADAAAAYMKGYQSNPEKTEMLEKVSEAYFDAKDYAASANAYQQYVDAGNNKTNDLFMLARRYFSYSVNLPEGSAERTEIAKLGLDAINQAIAKAPDQGTLYRTKAQLLMAIDSSQITPEIAQAYEKMVECYLTEPDGVTKRATALTSAYNSLGNYYNNLGDKVTARSYFEKSLELNPDNEDLRNYLKTFK